MNREIPRVVVVRRLETFLAVADAPPRTSVDSTTSQHHFSSPIFRYFCCFALTADAIYSCVFFPF